MVYSGNRRYSTHATSRDGLHWTKDPRNPIYRAAYAPNLVQTAPGDSGYITSSTEYWKNRRPKPR